MLRPGIKDYRVKDYMICQRVVFAWYQFRYLLYIKPITPSCFVRFYSHIEYEKGVNSFFSIRQQSGILDNERRLDPALQLWSV